MLACQKDRFFLPPGLHYLNCAYMAPMMDTVEAAGIEGIRQKRNPAEIGPAAFFDDSDRVRALFAELVNVADPTRIALLPAASYGLAVVAHNLAVRRGQNIVVVHEQFPSNVYPWRRLRDEHGAEIRTVLPPDEPEGRGRRWNERFLDAIDADTALVACGHVHWADGTLFDLDAIGRRAREVGAAFVVDGTQSVGALPFDVAALQPDALVCAGYKWLLGPYSLGVAYYGPRFDSGRPLEDNWILRRRSEAFSGLVDYEDAYQPGAIRYDVGERSNFILLPMLREALTQLLAWGVADIQAYGRDLLAPVLDDLRTEGFWVEEADHRAHHLVGLRPPASVSMERLRATLAEHRVNLSVRGSALRVAPHVYNDAADAEALRDAVRASLPAATG